MKFDYQGTAATGPASASAADGSTSTIDLKACAHYTKKVTGTIPISSTDLSPLPLALGQLSAIKFTFIRSVRKDPMVLLVTSAAGTAQRIPFDDTFSVRADASPVSALSVVGVGLIEYLLAGD